MNVSLRLLIAASLAFGPPDTFAAIADTGATDVPGIEPSNIALFAFAVIGLWLARR